ncbi:hypothetical protein [Runella slithyformis]|uniref:Uncharacterized protein n=1 Tax=Runella slithyformis (strain ATCC 29530 / DSM 19594 / LMG 11500 / NCIMB 11436 / LSU 4) TaxID=761193 RepID=A0A7U3ZGI0_RUNSL|nr:hypothetical protein [Runella slithyformis]AEI46760.1 hypothetical protein Runsl_0308 [Runella slithyformis DSM 19594]
MELTFIPTRKTTEDESVPKITLSKNRLAISKKLKHLFEQHNIKEITAVAVGEAENGYLYLLVNLPEKGVKLNHLKNGEIIATNGFFLEEMRKAIYNNRFLPTDKVNTKDTDGLLKIQVGNGLQYATGKGALAFPLMLASIKQVAKADMKGGAKK